MKKVINIIIIFLVCISTLFVLLATLRGVAGNPLPDQIKDDLGTQTMPFELSPERGRYALTMSIVENQSLSFSKEIAQFVVPDLGYVDGKYVSIFAPGVSYLAVPLYMVGKTLNLSQVFTFSLSSLFAFINFILMILIVKKLTNNLFAGITAGLTFLFATTAWPYAVTLYQHHITTFLLLATTYALSYKVNFMTAFIVSVLFGISIFVEYPNGIFFIPFLILLIAMHVTSEVKDNQVVISIKSTILLGIVGFAISLIPFFVYNAKAYGNPMQLSGTLQRVETLAITEEGQDSVQFSGTGGEKSATGFFHSYHLPNSLSVLLTSKDRGLIWYSPIMILAFLGLKPLYSKNKAICYALLGSIGTVFLLYGMWGDPWGGWAFGPRYLIPAMGIASIFLGTAISVYSRKIWFFLIFIILLGYSMFVNLIGALTTNQIPPSVEVDYARYPEITYLYNFDLVKTGHSGSFIYNTYFKDLLSVTDYAVIIYATCMMLILLCYLLSLKSRK